MNGITKTLFPIMEIDQLISTSVDRRWWLVKWCQGASLCDQIVNHFKRSACSCLSAPSHYRERMCHFDIIITTSCDISCSISDFELQHAPL